MFVAVLHYMYVNTPCLGNPAESPPESSPVKICFVKSLLSEKSWDFLRNLVYPGVNFESLVVPSQFLTITPMRFDITTVILLSPWCVAASRRDHGNPC